MRRLSKTVNVEVSSAEELPEDLRELLRVAYLARKRAYAPYSKFHVGAAIRTSRGVVYRGCNVERCSYSETTHAEQNAVDSAVADTDGILKLAAVAVVAAPASAALEYPPKRTGASIVTLDAAPVPCGHCLQIIWEHCGGDPRVKLVCLAGNGEVAVTSIGDAFPMRFGPDDIG